MHGHPAMFLPVSVPMAAGSVVFLPIRHGVRNSLLIAPMPTASTAQILGNNESIEAYMSNVYTRRVLSGEFQVTFFGLYRIWIRVCCQMFVILRAFNVLMIPTYVTPMSSCQPGLCSFSAFCDLTVSADCYCAMCVGVWLSDSQSSPAEGFDQPGTVERQYEDSFDLRWRLCSGIPYMRPFVFCLSGLWLNV